MLWSEKGSASKFFDQISDFSCLQIHQVIHSYVKLTLRRYLFCKCRVKRYSLTNTIPSNATDMLCDAVDIAIFEFSVSRVYLVSKK